MTLRWLVPQPVGMPGLIALAAGALLFFALVLRMTFTAAGADGSGSRSGLPRLGIGLGHYASLIAAIPLFAAVPACRSRRRKGCCAGGSAAPTTLMPAGSAASFPGSSEAPARRAAASSGGSGRYRR